MLSIQIPPTTPHIKEVDKGEGVYRVTVECPFCKQTTDVFAKIQGFDSWDFRRGAFIQVALPELSPNDRELLINGWDGC